MNGHDATTVDRATRDYQDVEKAGVLMSRGTIIDDKTAFEMAKNGDPELVRMVTNPYLSDKERETQIGVLARTIGNAISAFCSSALTKPSQFQRQREAHSTFTYFITSIKRYGPFSLTKIQGF